MRLRPPETMRQCVAEVSQVVLPVALAAVALEPASTAALAIAAGAKGFLSGLNIGKEPMERMESLIHKTTQDAFISQDFEVESAGWTR